MHEKSIIEIEQLPSNLTLNDKLALPQKRQEVFTISSTSFNFPSKKPCMLNCSHHHSHLNQKPPLPPRQKESDKSGNLPSSSDFIDKKIEIVRDVSQRKSEIWLNEQKRTIPSINKLNEFNKKETNTKNEYNATFKYTESYQCHNNHNTDTQDSHKNLKLNNFLDFASPLYHIKPNKSFPCQSPTKLDLEKPNNFWRQNILFNEPEIDYSNNCDMFKVIDKLNLKLNRFIKKKLLFISVIAILFFSIGLVVRFYSNCGKNESESSTSHLKRPKGLSSFYGRKASQEDSKDVLKELFISVKTTQKYHFPRVIVQLETWASLVKEQVITFITFEKRNYFEEHVLVIKYFTFHLIDFRHGIFLTGMMEILTIEPVEGWL